MRISINSYITIVIHLFSFSSHAATATTSLKKITPEKAEEMRSLPAQFSGALRWAHQKGFTGKEQTILVLESQQACGPRIECLQNKMGGKLEILEILDSHATHAPNHAPEVTFVAHQIAPDSKIILHYRPRSVDKISRDILQQARVINRSVMMFEEKTENLEY